MTAPPRFGLGEEERSARDAASDTARRFDADAEPGRAFTRDELRALFRALAPLGYLSSILPDPDSGRAASVPRFAAMVEGVSPDLPLLGNHSVQRYLHAHGDPEQKARYLPGLLTGEAIAAIAISEPGVGGDLKAMTTEAKPSDGGYVLNGEKHWVTHGPSADFFVVLARTGKGATRFLVPRGASGLAVTPMATVGLRRLGFARLHFSDCRIAAENRLGPEGAGLEGAKSAFPIARLLAGLQAIRLGEAAVELAVEMASERRIFGRRLIDAEVVHGDAAEHLARSEAARLLCYQGLAGIDAAGATGRASIAKAVATATAQGACAWSRALLGAAALEATHPINRLAADLDMMAVVDGTATLNRLVAGRRLQRRHASSN